MEDWEPTTLAKLQAVLAGDLSRCTAAQLALWERCRVSPRRAAIVRYGSPEHVFVVAEHKGEAIYWEDVEEGFNVSPLGPSGEVLEHWCNQDELRWALNRWLQPSAAYQRVGPAQPVKISCGRE